LRLLAYTPTNAVVGYDFRSHNLTAALAYFFFDDVIVALGCNVSDARPNALVWTTLASRLVPPAADPAGALTVSYVGGAPPSVLPDGNYSLVAAAPGVPGAVQWLWVGGLGIIPALADTTANASIAPTSLNVSIGTATAPWSRIGPYSGSVSGRLFKAILDHGDGVQGASFAYALAPNVSAVDMPGVFVSGAGLSCLANSPQVQGVAVPSEGVLGAVFWPQQPVPPSPPAYVCDSAAFPPGTGISFYAHSPAMVLVRVNASAVSVSVSQPLRLGPTIVTVSRTVSGLGCSPSQTEGATDFTIPTASDDPNFVGAPVTVVCTF
jgi:hypothetical protein